MTYTTDFILEQYNTALKDAKVYRELYYEMGQLYGALIAAMHNLGLMEIEITKEELEMYHKEWQILFVPGLGDDRLTVILERQNK